MRAIIKKKLVVILYSDAKRKYFSSVEQYKTEAEVYFRSKIIKKRLEKLGFRAILLPGDVALFNKLKKLKPYIALNLVDSVGGKEDKISLIPAVLDFLSIPYTGAGITGLSINANKCLTKIILKQSGISVPKFQLFMSEKQKLNKNINFPLIVKLNEAHGSLEINQKAIVTNEEQLSQRVKYLIDKYKQSVLAEEYIRGKEVTALMIDDKNKEIVLAEERILFKKDKYPLYDFEAAWGKKEIYDCIKYKLNRRITEDIKKAFEVLQFKDYGRFEIIINKNGDYYFIDSNANPAFGPYGTTSGPFGYLLHVNKISFDLVAKKIINNAITRSRNKYP
jgi:D-alanine-D-alanine ligase